jgi:hypothetical protein
MAILENHSHASIKNRNRLVEKCQLHTKELEGYVETIEIETDPQQREILNRVKSQ